jgi:SRSO17 transposase
VAVVASVEVTGLDLLAWRAGFEDMFARIAGRFGRVEPRRRARAYVLGLLGQVERKNGWQLAEYAGDVGPDGMQRLLNHYRWNPDLVRDDLRGYVAEHLGTPDGVLIVDDTGFIKKGRHSAGVQRQYTGTSGKVDNCQLGVFLAYASGRGRALVDRELYLPHSWTDDPARCAAAGIPVTRRFATKPALALAMLRRTHAAKHAAGMPFGWVTADEAFGQDPALRTWLESGQIGYVLAVGSSHRLPGAARPASRPVRADALAKLVPKTAWQRISAGDGAKGPRVYDWALMQAGPDHQLLVRRSITDGELAYYRCYAPGGATLAELVRVAGARWAIEECFAAAKNETGLDHYEVRRYDAWYRHVTLAMLAHAWLAARAAAAHADTAQKGTHHLWTTAAARGNETLIAG